MVTTPKDSKAQTLPRPAARAAGQASKSAGQARATPLWPPPPTLPHACTATRRQPCVYGYSQARTPVEGACRYSTENFGGGLLPLPLLLLPAAAVAAAGNGVGAMEVRMVAPALRSSSSAAHTRCASASASACATAAARALPDKETLLRPTPGSPAAWECGGC